MDQIGESFYCVNRRGWPGIYISARNPRDAAEKARKTGKVKVTNGSTGTVTRYVVIYNPTRNDHTAINADNKRVRHLR